MVVARVLLVVARVVLGVVMWFLTGWVKRNSPLSLCDILAVADIEHDVMVVARVLMVVARVLMLVARVLLVVVMWFLTGWVIGLLLCDILAVADMEHVLLMVVAKVLMVVARVLMVVARVLLVVAKVLLVLVMWFLTGLVKRSSPLSLCDILAVAAMEHDVDGGC